MDMKTSDTRCLPQGAQNMCSLKSINLFPLSAVSLSHGARFYGSLGQGASEGGGEKGAGFR